MDGLAKNFVWSFRIASWSANFIQRRESYHFVPFSTKLILAFMPKRCYQSKEAELPADDLPIRCIPTVVTHRLGWRATETHVHVPFVDTLWSLWPSEEADHILLNILWKQFYRFETCSKQEEFMGGVGLGAIGVLPPQNLDPEVTWDSVYLTWQHYGRK